MQFSQVQGSSGYPHQQKLAVVFSWSMMAEAGIFFEEYMVAFSFIMLTIGTSSSTLDQKSDSLAPTSIGNVVK